MTGWVLAPGTEIVLLSTGWVAYSAQSGESHLLNDESVAVLDALHPEEPRTVAQVCDRIVREHQQEHQQEHQPGLVAAELEQLLGSSWNALVEAGLVREAASAARP
jgi:hypothetical protein